MMQGRIYYLALLAIIVSTSTGCNRKMPVAEILSTYKTGIVKEEKYIDCKDKDRYTLMDYYDNGKISEVSNFKNGQKDGIKIYYNKNGTISAKLTYQASYKIDTIFDYSDSGVIRQMQIIKGKCDDTLCCCDGIHLNFENGKLRERFYMKDKGSDGLHELFYPSGKLEQKFYLNNCDWEGPSQSWYENGKPQSEGNYQYDKKEGVWKFWESDGGWIVETYSEGTLDGPATEYYADTSKEIRWAKGQNLKGKESGRWYMLDKDSILVYECDYKNGEKTGEYIGYYKNGKIKVRGNEIKFEWDGLVKRYNENGELTNSTLYRKGKKAQ